MTKASEKKEAQEAADEAEAAAEVASQTQTQAREEKLRDEDVKQRTAGDSEAMAAGGNDPAKGPVPRSGDPYAAQRAEAEGNFEKIEEPKEDAKKK